MNTNPLKDHVLKAEWMGEVRKHEQGLLSGWGERDEK